MNYRHIYHAGNLADVVKHITLSLLINALKQKDKSFCYIDTHAGIGIYDLTQIQAQKTAEYQSGILALLQQTTVPPVCKDYFAIIQNLNKDMPPNTLRYYPGSPWITFQLLRAYDQMILNELHPKDFQLLKMHFQKNKQISLHHRNAYEFLPAILPPVIKRGLVLIDPPFEKENEFSEVIQTVQKSLKRWPQAIYMIWMPIKTKSLLKFYREFKIFDNERKAILEFNWQPENISKLSGCAIAILNLPWQVEYMITSAMSWLASINRRSQYELMMM